MTNTKINPVYDAAVSWVTENSSVLDLGCGGGELLERLSREKRARVTGIEIDEQAIYSCVARGLSVLHEDLEAGLKDFADKSFDYVILLDTFQQVRRPAVILDEALRVGKKVVAGFPNFANLKSRMQIFLGGRAPVTPALPYKWHDTPNLHFLSALDFEDYIKEKNITVEKREFFTGIRRVRYLPNLFGEEAVYLLSAGKPERNK
ncbi:MAG: methionine biosynthesis protein MetW [Elusimicrobia bacterium HGW-Elusimicrobia-1]|jgi:methionine biosynthesis protein MetW|nr:MAG: methionine biosynthesis protein MetW [Elusimicrobia bacterium HGW-Elusimicrobia-1]